MHDVSWLGQRIDVRPLLATWQATFIRLLRQLDAADWARPTACPDWTVQDVAVHVLGDHVGVLSRHRDAFRPLRPRPDETLPSFLNRINDEWVIAARRLSPRLLVELLSRIGDQVVDFRQAIDLHALGETISWAGPDPAPVWLDAAREITETWTHHQQISEATSRPGLTQPEYLGPVLDTFLRALPHTLRDLTAPEGSILQVTVTGPAGRTWTCQHTPHRWELTTHPRPHPDARIELEPTPPGAYAPAASPPTKPPPAHTSGDPDLTAAALQIVSIIH